MQFLQKQATGIFDLLFPPMCLVCGEVLNERDDSMCSLCEQSMVPVGHDVCPTCGYPSKRIRSQKKEKSHCKHCPARPVHFESARAAFLYHGHFPEVVHAYKYDRRYALGQPLAHAMFMAHHRFYPERLSDQDMFIPVPLHFMRRAQRGYNQAQVLAEEIAQLTKTPCVSDLMVRRRRTKRQALLPHNERAQNVFGAFEVSRPERIRGKNIGLIDDVITSGNTVNECARVLIEAGAERVQVLALTRA